MRNNQSGRSMVEMLCVLAIIGVLTVGGLKGYQYMVARYKANKIAETVAFIVTQIRTGYSTQENYAGLDNEIAINIGAIPEPLIEKDNHNNITHRLPTPWGGFVNIFASAKRSDSVIIDPNTGETLGVDGFVVEVGNISRRACTLLATNDWGNATNGGFVGLVASSATCSAAGNTGYAITYAGGGTSTNSSTMSDSYGINSIYLDESYEGNTRRDEVSGRGFAYGIPGSRKWSIPVSPAAVSKACRCITEDNEEIDTCSFAVKFY